MMGNVYATMDTIKATAQVNWFYFHCLRLEVIFFPLPKVLCDAINTCNGHGSCTNHGDCQCDNGFYAANCSGKLSLNYSIIKIYFAILNALLE